MCRLRCPRRVYVAVGANLCSVDDNVTPNPTHRKCLKQFPTSGRFRRMLAQAEMESNDWQAADKVQQGRNQTLVDFGIFLEECGTCRAVVVLCGCVVVGQAYRSSDLIQLSSIVGKPAGVYRFRCLVVLCSR